MCCPFALSETSNLSLRMPYSATTALSNCQGRYLADTQSDIRGFSARWLQDKSLKRSYHQACPIIARCTALFGHVPHDRKRRPVSTIMCVITTARSATGRYFGIAVLMKCHAKKKIRSKMGKENEGVK